MVDLIVFSIATNRYAMNIENVQRIVQSIEVTKIPNAHAYIDGMIPYEEQVLKVLNFRKLINMPTYESELTTLFQSLKKSHQKWVEALKLSLETGVEFTKTVDSHACELGKWIDSFTAYDDTVVEILHKLVVYHKDLHVTGAMALKVYKMNPEEALLIFKEKIEIIYKNTMGALDKFTDELGLIGNSLQKLIIYNKGKKVFAIKVDTIDDIAHVDEEQLIESGNKNDKGSEFLELDGVLELSDVLINVIKTVKLPI